MNNQKKIVEKFTMAMCSAKRQFESQISINEIKAWDEAVVDYEVFYFISMTKFVYKIREITEAFANERFGYLVKMELCDNSTINIFVKKDSFQHDFLSEDSVVIE